MQSVIIIISDLLIQRCCSSVKVKLALFTEPQVSVSCVQEARFGIFDLNRNTPRRKVKGNFFISRSAAGWILIIETDFIPTFKRRLERRNQKDEHGFEKMWA